MNESDRESLRKIRSRLRNYEAKLRREKATYGTYNDGAGKRYQIGPLHLLLGDLDGAAEAFRWFTREFADDHGEPGHSLCWTLTLLRAGDELGAAKKLRRTMLSNLYLIPRLLGQDIAPLDIWHPSSDAQSSYLSLLPSEYFTIWEVPERAWAERLYHGGGFTKVRERYIEIYRALRHVRPGPERNRLLDEAFALER